MASRRYSIVIADRTSGVIRRFTLPLGPAVATIVTALTLPILIGLGARWSALATLDELTSTNASLTVENENYRDATGQLSSQIAALQAAVDEIGATAAVDPDGQPGHGAAPGDRPLARHGRRRRRQRASAMPSAAGDAAFGVLRDVLGAIEHRLRRGADRRRAPRARWPTRPRRSGRSRAG